MPFVPRQYTNIVTLKPNCYLLFLSCPMIRLICFIAVLLGIGLDLAAQTPPLDEKKFTDSLNSLLNGNADVAVKARANFALSYYWSDLDTVKSWQYLNKGKTLSKNNPYLQALSNYFTAAYFWETNKALAKRMYMKSDSLLARFSLPEAYLYRARAWLGYGSLLQHEDQEKKFMDILLTRCIPLAQKAGDMGMVGNCYLNVGLVFTNTLHYDKAAEYFLKAIPLLKPSPYPSVLADTYMRAAKNYILQKKFPSSKAMLDQAKALLEPYPASVFTIDYYQVEGMYFDRMGLYNEAQLSFDKGIVLAKQKNKPYSVESLLFEKYKTYSKQGKYENAKQVLLHILQQPSLPFASNRIRYYYELAGTYSKLGDFRKAYEWSDKALLLLDSTSEARIKTDINELEIKYQAAEKQKKIALLSAEKKHALLTLKNNRLYSWLLAGACLFLFILVFFIFFYYKSQKKIASQKVIELEQQQQIELVKAMLNAEESERNRLAKDLHDGLGSMLAGIKISLSAWAKTKTQDAELQQILAQLDGSVTELRHIARNMMPQTLLLYGLEAALKELCESVMRNNLSLHFEAINLEKTIPLNAQVTIYRIAQEILANVIKHAQATSILFQCSQNQHRFYLTVEDNGRGFDPTSQNPGMGINNIKNRVAHLNGSIQLHSKPAEGTAINIELDV